MASGSLWALSLVGILTFTSAAPVQADPYGTGTSSTGRIPSSTSLTACFHSSVTSTFRTQMNASFTYMETYTKYSRTNCPSGTIMPNFTWYQSTALGSTVRGRYNCYSVTVTLRCARATATLNPDLLTNANNRRKTACHELGHALGLTHHASGYGCMVNGAVSVATYNIVPHHREHIESGTRSSS